MLVSTIVPLLSLILAAAVCPGGSVVSTTCGSGWGATLQAESGAQAPLQTSSDDQQLLEIGRAPRLQATPKTPAQFKVISYNIRWRSGEELRKLIRLFRDDPELGGAALLGLQEVDRNKKRTGNSNTAKLLAEELGMYYAWAAPPTAKPEQEEETGVAILSVYPLSEVRRIVLPHPGPGQRRRVALGATIEVGKTRLRFYSVHSESRMGVDRKLEQMNAVLEDLAKFPRKTAAVVLGDLNTWQRKAVKKTFQLFRAADFETPFDKRSTFCMRVLFINIPLKLDWIWLRGLEAKSYGIDRNVNISDHCPLWVVVQPKPNRAVLSKPGL
ncbi:MAG: endonuclease/exonuclease/phosphatase family protein [Pyrinomonadaceae bacterium]